MMDGKWNGMEWEWAMEMRMGMRELGMESEKNMPVSYLLTAFSPIRTICFIGLDLEYV
jgi:hypothetical protein